MAKLGLDIGSSSLGWFIDRTIKGVVTFDTGMSKGQSGGYTSPTTDRREARSKRNLIRARKYRKWELLKVLLNEYVPLGESELNAWSKYQKGKKRKFPESEKFLKWLACDFTYEGNVKYTNPYELRVKALNEKISNHEFGRVLYHLVQRRGYKDIGETDQETEKQIQRRAESGFQTALDRNRTIGETLLNEFLIKGERARNQYPYREEYKNELELICKSQQFSIVANEKGEYLDQFVRDIWKAIIWQRPLKGQKGNIGKCTLEPSKLRCPVSHPAFEIFRALQFINTIMYFNENNEKQILNPDLKKELFKNLFLKQDSNFKFQEIKNYLDKHSASNYKYNYPINPKNNQYETSVAGMPVCKSLISLFGNDAMQGLLKIENFHIGNAPKFINKYSIYDIWHIVFDFDEQHLGKFAVEKLEIENVNRKRKGEDFSISPLVELKRKFSQGYSDVSLKAICKTIPFLKEGYLYNEAVVLAKIPELMGTDWQSTQHIILDVLKESKKIYQEKLIISSISNNLIDKHKGQTRAVIDGNEDGISAFKDFSHLISEKEEKEVKDACINHFGEQTWNSIQNKVEIIQKVGLEYQEYFFDHKRTYRKSERLTDIFKLLLKEENITLNGELYHHSDRENLYNKNLLINFKTGEKYLPKYKDTETEILPIPFIDSIKNPMFNKSMSIVRKLLNELIMNGEIDQETEVTVELARELNDNNIRSAIERYQKERRDNREKIRKFLEQYNHEENRTINIEDNIPLFELWTEQIFEETKDENQKKIQNKNRLDVLREKEDVKRYELWTEQKGQCMYTGRMISISQLFSNEIDLEHTIPRSILPDNTLANQTVAFSKYNRDIKAAKTPYYCENYSKDTPNGTSISPRLESWRKLRDYYKMQYETRIYAKGAEDINAKNTRIKDKHYYKLHFEYWNNKLNRFEADEIKDSWARRQLVDTQMVSKYAREYLKLYFKKVAVQKGSVTADFRKIFGFQEQDEIKSRNKHTHHAIDAAVLTMIPTNSSYRDKVLKEYYLSVENKDKRKIDELRKKMIPPFFNVQSLINEIESTTLIVNYQKDKILQQTSKTVRKRGAIQYVKIKKGEFLLDKNGDKIIKKAKGDTIRSTLYAQTYLGKIRDVERYADSQPQRENNDWKYKKGKDEFIFVKRENIYKVKESDKLIESIIDPNIKKLVSEQKNNAEIKDFQGNVIRHVRVKTSTGREVKERLNYRSKYDYKNKFYSEAGSVPYSILAQRIYNGTINRELIPISSFEIAIEYKKYGKFVIENFISEKYPEFTRWDKKLLKTSQKVIVLNEDGDFEKRLNRDFQQKRLFVINQFSEGSIWLNFHLNALSKDEVKKSIASIKDEKLLEFEKEYNLPDVVEDGNIHDNKKRRNDFLNRKFRFDTIGNSYRLSRLVETIGLIKTNEIKKELDKYKAIPSTIEIEGETPLLKMSKEKWNFLFEGEDFELSLDGKTNWKS